MADVPKGWDMVEGGFEAHQPQLKFTDERRELLVKQMDEGRFFEADRTAKNGINQSWMPSRDVQLAQNAYEGKPMTSKQRDETIQKGRDVLLNQFDKNREMERSNVERVKDLTHDSQRVFGDRR